MDAVPLGGDLANVFSHPAQALVMSRSLLVDNVDDVDHLLTRRCNSLGLSYPISWKALGLLEEISALSTASMICQIVNFTNKIVHFCIKIYCEIHRPKQNAPNLHKAKTKTIATNTSNVSVLIRVLPNDLP